MTGIILAGGLGSRMGISHRSVNKHCNLVYKYPMIMYPLYNLKEMNINDIIVVVSDVSATQIVTLLGNGEEFDMNITYRFQSKPLGIAHALGMCRSAIKDDGEPIVVILGDNFFEDVTNINPTVSVGECIIILTVVPDPNSYGVLSIGCPYEYRSDDDVEWWCDDNHNHCTFNEMLDYHSESLSIIEKPTTYIGNLSQTGMYIYTYNVFDHIDTLELSSRNELEVSDLNTIYIKNGAANFMVYNNKWLDCGEPDRLLEASNYVKDISKGLLLYQAPSL